MAGTCRLSNENRVKAPASCATGAEIASSSSIRATIDSCSSRSRRTSRIPNELGNWPARSSARSSWRESSAMLRSSRTRSSASSSRSGSLPADIPTRLRRLAVRGRKGKRGCRAKGAGRAVEDLCAGDLCTRTRVANPPLGPATTDSVTVAWPLARPTSCTRSCGRNLIPVTRPDWLPSRIGRPPAEAHARTIRDASPATTRAPLHRANVTPRKTAVIRPAALVLTVSWRCNALARYVTTTLCRGANPEPETTTGDFAASQTLGPCAPSAATGQERPPR